MRYFYVGIRGVLYFEIMSVVTEFVSALKGHKWQISCLEFKSAANTVYLASGSWDKHVRIWDLSRIETSTKLKGVHEGAITSLAWCSRTKEDNNILATASADNSACIWDCRANKNLARLAEHSGWVLDCSFSCDGHTLATSSWDTKVKLWDVETRKCVRTLDDHESGVWTCKYHTDNPYIVCSGSEDGSLRVWDERSTTSKYFGGQDDSVRSCSWSSNGDYLVSGSADSTIILWDFRQNVALSKCCGHEAAVSDVKFYPLVGPKRYPLLLSSGDYTVRMWHPLRASPKELLKLKQHNFGAEVETIAISDDGTLLASGGLDNQIILTAMEVPIDKLEDISVDTSNDSMSKNNPRERRTSDDLDECDGLPHRGKGSKKLEELNLKKEHLIVPPLTSAAGVLEGALEKRDSGVNGSSASNEQTSKKAVKTRRKGNKINRQRPRSYVGVNGSSVNSSLLNVELSKKLASLKRVKTRSDSDPIPVDMARTGKNKNDAKGEQLDNDHEEMEAITNEMMSLAKELEKGAFDSEL